METIGFGGEKVQVNRPVVRDEPRTYAFDMDDTITAAPEVFKPLMASLVAAGHVVLIITGALKGHGEGFDGKARQLTMMGILQGRHYNWLHVVQEFTAKEFAIAKRKICEDNAVCLMFEDRSDFATEISKTSQVLLMWPR